MKELERGSGGSGEGRIAVPVRGGDGEAERRAHARASGEHRVAERGGEPRRTTGTGRMRDRIAEGFLRAIGGRAIEKRRAGGGDGRRAGGTSHGTYLMQSMDNFKDHAYGLIMSLNEPVIVIGAGAGGLSAAIELAIAGCSVTVLDRADRVGGKIRSIDVLGRSIDAGPTVLTMRWVFDALFARAGRTLDDYVALEPLDVLARHAWPDGSRLDLFADRDRTAAAIGELAGPVERASYLAFAEDARRIHDTVEGPFLRGDRPTLGSIVAATRSIGIGALARIDAHRTMWSALSARFRDPRLIQLFARYATYVGSSPFEASGTFNLVAHVESLGVHRARGGMSALAEGLATLARELGVEIVLGAHVDRVVIGRAGAEGVALAGGGVLPARAVVVAADVSAVGDGLFGSDAARAATPTPRRERSFSAVTCAAVARVRGFPLAHHNVLFSSDYPAELAALRRGELPAVPTVYACAPDRGDGAAEGEAERLFLITNAPATGDEPARWDESERVRCENSIWKAMQGCGLEVTPDATVTTTPLDFARRFPATGGALYGPRAKGPLSPFSRAGAATKIAGVYLAGGSVHPGPGVPMAVLSGARAAEATLRHLASTARSRPAATSGSTSTERATTVPLRSS